MNQNAAIVFSIVSEIFLLAAIGFVLGWIVVLSTDNAAKKSVKLTVAVLFAMIAAWLGTNTPQVLLLFYAFKVPLMILFSFVMTYFFFRDADLNRRNLSFTIKNTLLVEVVMLAALLIVWVIGLLLARVVAVFIEA